MFLDFCQICDIFPLSWGTMNSASQRKCTILLLYFLNTKPKLEKTSYSNKLNIDQSKSCTFWEIQVELWSYSSSNHPYHLSLWVFCIRRDIRLGNNSKPCLHGQCVCSPNAIPSDQQMSHALFTIAITVNGLVYNHWLLCWRLIAYYMYTC